MVPSVFVLLEALPLTPNGKIDRRALPAPHFVQSALDDAYVAPRSPVEEVLASVWMDVLRLERVGVHDNFFELGGHSLLATQVVSRVRNTLHVELPLQHLFDTPTVAGPAACLTAGRQAEPVSQGLAILPVPRQQAMPLSFPRSGCDFLTSGRLRVRSTAFIRHSNSRIDSMSRFWSRALTRSCNAMKRCGRFFAVSRADQCRLSSHHSACPCQSLISSSLPRQLRKVSTSIWRLPRRISLLTLRAGHSYAPPCYVWERQRISCC